MEKADHVDDKKMIFHKFQNAYLQKLEIYCKRYFIKYQSKQKLWLKYFA